jgi:asparagine synthase (glutamine-hydrolysing)
MCGIFGAIGDGDDAALEAARRALALRGPDVSAEWRSGPVGLAHTRLRIIDLSEAAKQPMAGCTPDVQVTFNGEIYNHQALRRELEARGHRFRTRSDTEAIVHGYEEWGDEVVARLDGMFAFGLWDARRSRLLLARDRCGKKPLFYTWSPGGALRFASEIKALHAAGHTAALDELELPMFLAWGYVPAPATLHRGVKQLAPASYLTLERGGEPRVVEYWRPPFLEPPLAIDFDEARARVRALTIAAVERRLESDVPLGAFLSGGVDSTIIVGIMARLLGRKVKTFSIGFAGDARFDETPFARIAARAFSTEHTEFTLEPSSVEVIEKLVYLHDGPFADSSAIPTYAVSRLTRQHVTVALAGDGGDELFAGYLRFLAAEAAERIPSPLRRALGSAARRVPGALPVHSLVARARRFLAAGGLSLADRMAMWNSSFALELPSLLRPELAARVDLDEPLKWHASLFGRGSSTLASILSHNFHAYLANDLLPKVDRCSAGVGLEVRSPFLDTALIELAARLPDAHKRRGLRTKVVLRAAFEDLLPHEIATRPKRGFAVPLAVWFRGPLRPFLVDTLGPHARVKSFLQSASIDRMVDDHLHGRADRSAQLWTLLTLEVWLASLGSR